VQRKPYTFDLDNPSDWENYPAPYLDPRYVDELTEIGGRNANGEPNLIFEWGGSAREEIDGKSELKYYACTTAPKFAPWRNPTTGLVAMARVTTDIGHQRWFVSRWIPPHAGFPRGRYVFFFKLAESNGDYAAIGQCWLERIRQHWHYTLNRSATEYAAEIASAVASPDLIDALA
jgi:hypothetical protein